MSSQNQLQEASFPTLSVLRRLSRPIGKASSSSSTTSNENTCREVVAMVPSSTTSSKFTPLKRLKSQLEKRRRISKDNVKGVERTPPPTAKISGHTPALESIPQPSDTTTEARPSQNTPSIGFGEAVGDNESSLNESGQHETSDPRVDGTSQAISTTTLARRIQALLSPSPSPHALTHSGAILPPNTSDQCETTPSINADSTLFSLLSSVSTMNGSISRGRESVWAALERLRYSPHPHPNAERRENGEDDTAISHDDHEAQNDNAEMSSIMICCPLQPTEDTEVEVARSEVVSVDFEEIPDGPAPAEQAEEQGVGMVHWPFGKKNGKGKEKEAATVTMAKKALPPSPPKKKKEVRVWYPSRTKVSLQAFWWGYRIYLPPPVMRVLSDKSLEAAKRAAMMTAALTWLVSHLPTTMLPPQMRAIVEILKHIVPIMGYVGGFIAWSWSTIQGFDKGQGVTLSATWLLPIALVPGTWSYVEPPIFPLGGEPSGT